jgi:type IV pilus assembly protein PilQ
MINKKRFIKTYFFPLLLFFFTCTFAMGQDVKVLQEKLDSLAEEIPALNDTVDITVNGVSIQEFIRAIANNTGLNITIDPSLNYRIVNNFSRVKVKDVLVYLAKVYHLEIKAIGNILMVDKHIAPPEPEPIPPDHDPVVEYDTATGHLSLELKQDTLYEVAKAIIDKTGKNVIISSPIRDQTVNGYIKNMPFDNVMDKLAYANGLEVSKTKDGFYLVEEQIQTTETPQGRISPGSSARSSTRQRISARGDDELPEFEISAERADSISLSAIDQPVYDIIKAVSEELGINYYMLSEIDKQITLEVNGVTYDNMMAALLEGTEYAYSKHDDSYLVGKIDNTALKTTKVIQLQYRTVDKITEFIPEGISKETDVIELTESNSLIITGTQLGVKKIEDFIYEIDKIIPVVLIEVMIVDITRSHTFSAGITAGLGEGVSQSTGSLYPGLDMQLSTQAVNDVIQGINGFGWIRLGRVTPHFYATIKAMEDNGILQVRSTPKLSTLNGHEASMTRGQTTYYKEERSNFIGTQNPSLSKSFTWKALNADLQVSIKPIVSGDGHITLDIEVSQSDFTGREFKDAPPNSVTRTFKSSIRVKNQEMILLGGLEEIKKENTGTGVPFLSRIPVIKWLFSSRTRSKSNAKLNLFIKPTVIY